MHHFRRVPCRRYQLPVWGCMRFWFWCWTVFWNWGLNYFYFHYGQLKTMGSLMHWREWRLVRMYIQSSILKKSLHIWGIFTYECDWLVYEILSQPHYLFYLWNPNWASWSWTLKDWHEKHLFPLLNWTQSHDRSQES